MDILEEYKKQFELDKQNENYELPKTTEGNKPQLTEEQLEVYKKELDTYRKNDDDLLKAFQQKFIPLTDKELKEKGKLTPVQVNLKVIKAYCPECGEEIVSMYPSAYDMFTLRKIARYECPKCHTKYNLENAYPRLAVFDMYGNEIKCFLD